MKLVESSGEDREPRTVTNTYNDIQQGLALDVERDILDDYGGGYDLVIRSPADGR